VNQAPPAPAAPARVRTTERVDSSSGPLARKLFRRGGLLDRLGLRPCAAAREHASLARLRALGLPVPEPVAFEPGGGPRGEDLLATRWIEGSSDLASLTADDGPDRRQRRHLARRLGELVRALHDAGAVHRDLHAGNVLVRPDGSLALVDFHRARFTTSQALRKRDVLALAHHFLSRSTTGERLRFARAYGAGCETWTEAALCSRLAFQLHHEKRCLGGGRAFVHIKGNGGAGSRVGRGVARREWDAAAIARLAPDPEGTARSHGRLVHAGGDAELWRVELDGLPFPLAVKLFRDRGPLKRWLRGSRARRAWRNLFRLGMAGVATPRTVLFLESSPLSAAPRSILVTEFVDGASMLHDRIARSGVAPLWPQLDDLAGTLARMHDEGLCHRDLKAENLLVPPSGPIVLVEADGVRRRRRVDLERAARDLMRLNASFRDAARVTWRDRLRFLAGYVRARRFDRPGRRELARAIMVRTAIKWLDATAR